jgi:hypothetical protein
MGLGKLTDIQVPQKPRLNFDEDTFYFDEKFTKMPLNNDLEPIMGD